MKGLSDSENELSFFKSVSDFFWKKTDGEGRLRCPWHQVEHTGKNVYVAGIDLFLFERLSDDEYFARAKKRLLFTLRKLGQDLETGAWIFFPGRFGKRNLSGNVIDCGACVDVLSKFYADHSGALSRGEADAVLDAVEKVAESYLKTAVVKKEIPNQRLWGATGLAAAYSIVKRPEWSEACYASLQRSVGEQYADGAFPYHPNWREYGAHEGISDISPYYHSRHLAFLHYALAQLDDEGNEAYREPFLKGCEFLVGITHPDGVKEMAFEQKRYYWNPRYEIASNTFDIYALAHAFRMTGDVRFGYYAQQGMRQLLSHQQSDGGIVGSSHPTEDYKCRIFVNAQLVWAARALEALPRETLRLPAEESAYFPDAGVVKVCKAKYGVMWRYKKKPAQITWGPLAGGGGLVYLARKSDWKNALPPLDLCAPKAGEFVLITGRRSPVKNFKAFLKKNTPHDIRFRLWLASVEFRAGKVLHGLSYPVKNILTPALRALTTTYSSRWPLAVEARFSAGFDEVEFTGSLADVDGKLAEGTRLKRIFRLRENELVVTEEIEVKGKHRALKYLLPEWAESVTVKSGSPHRIEGGRVEFPSPTNLHAAVEYRYRA